MRGCLPPRDSMTSPTAEDLAAPALQPFPRPSLRHGGGGGIHHRVQVRQALRQRRRRRAAHRALVGLLPGPTAGDVQEGGQAGGVAPLIAPLTGAPREGQRHWRPDRAGADSTAGKHRPQRHRQRRWLTVAAHTADDASIATAAAANAHTAANAPGHDKLILRSGHSPPPAERMF